MSKISQLSFRLLWLRQRHVYVVLMSRYNNTDRNVMRNVVGDTPKWKYILTIKLPYFHWLHRKLPKWQLSVAPVSNIFVKITFLFQYNDPDVFVNCILVINNQHSLVNTLRPRQNGRHFADDTFKRIFLNENVRISIKISLKFVPKGPINNIPALVQMMAWRRPGD